MTTEYERRERARRDGIWLGLAAMLLANLFLLIGFNVGLRFGAAPPLPVPDPMAHRVWLEFESPREASAAAAKVGGTVHVGTGEWLLTRPLEVGAPGIRGAGQERTRLRADWKPRALLQVGRPGMACHDITVSDMTFEGGGAGIISGLDPSGPSSSTAAAPGSAFSWRGTASTAATRGQVSMGDDR